MDFVGVNRRQNESGVLRGGKFFPGNPSLKVVGITVSTTTFSAGFGIKGIMEVLVRQDSFVKIYYGKATEVRLLLLAVSDIILS